MSHGPATGAVIDGAVESLRCRHMSLGSEYMNGPAPRVTLGISGENNRSHRHYHTTPHDATQRMTHRSLAHSLSRVSCVVWRQFKSNHRLPPALFAYTVLYCLHDSRNVSVYGSMWSDSMKSEMWLQLLPVSEVADCYCCCEY